MQSNEEEPRPHGLGHSLVDLLLLYPAAAVTGVMMVQETLFPSNPDQAGPKMSSDDLVQIRKLLGLSANSFADRFGIDDGRTVRRYEAGDRRIPGPLIVLLRLVMESPEVRLHMGLRLPSDPPEIFALR